eukprot:6160522-Amphidinium_carterae.2
MVEGRIRKAWHYESACFGSFCGGCWHYGEPLHGWKVWWEMAYVQASLFQPGAKPSWMKDRWLTWESMWKEHGGSADELCKSRLSQTRAAHRAGSDLDVEDVADLLSDATATTRAVLLILCAESQKHAKRKDEEVETARKVLCAYLESFFGSSSMKVAIDMSAVESAEILAQRGFDLNGCVLDLRPAVLLLGNAKALELSAETTRRIPQVADKVHLGYALVSLFQQAGLKRARRGVQDMFRALVLHVAQLVDGTAAEERWNKMNVLALPLLRGKERLCKVPLSSKIALHDAAVTDSRVGSAGSLLAAKRLLEGRVHEDPASQKRQRTTQDWHWQIMWQYRCTKQKNLLQVGLVLH